MHIALQKQQIHAQGGLEKYTLRLASAFCSMGSRVTMLCNECNVQLPCDVVEFGKEKGLKFRRLRTFNKQCSDWVNNNQPSALFGMDRPSEWQTHYRAGNGVHASYLNLREGSYFKKLSFKWNPLHRTILDMEKKAYTHAGLRVIFANSHMVKNELIHYYGTDEEKIHVVHNGVEWKEFEDCYLSWKPKERFQFLFIGHEYRRKGLDRLLYALALLKEDFHLQVVGKDRNEKYYQQLVRKLGLTHQVTFYGAQKKTLPFYQQADCVVIPSLYDPFANVTVEALAMGNFVVTSSGNGGKEVIAEETGRVVEDCQNPEALAAALQEAFNRPKTKSSATTIRQTVKHLDFDRMLDRIVNITMGTI